MFITLLKSLPQHVVPAAGSSLWENSGAPRHEAKKVTDLLCQSARPHGVPLVDSGAHVRFEDLCHTVVPPSEGGDQVIIEPVQHISD